MRIGVIGFGNLGKAFVSGLIKSGFNQSDICVTAKTQKTLDSVNSFYPNIQVFSNKSDLINFSDIVIISVEPQNAEEVCEEMKNDNFGKKVIISFMSGIRISDLKKNLNNSIEEYNIIRAMPNIAISNCNGIIGLANESSLPIDLLNEIIKFFGKLGRVIQVKEEELETITVSASCGLAFGSMMMKAYQNAILSLIHDHDLSMEITLQLFEGIISLIKERQLSFDKLNDIIATKGGSTEAGLRNLDTVALQTLIDTSLEAAYKRTKNMRGL